MALIVIARVRNSGIGRTIIAIRDNQQVGAAFTVSPTRAKLTAFAISGGLCGLAGGLFAGLLIQFGVADFPVETSISVVTIAVIGGLGSIFGPLLGALWVIGLPAIFGNDPNVALLTSGLGLLLLLMYFPAGIIGLVYAVRDRILAHAARHRTSPPAREDGTDVAAATFRSLDRPASTAATRHTKARKTYPRSASSTSRSTSAASQPSTTSVSRSVKARSSDSSAPTEPANRHS